MAAMLYHVWRCRMEPPRSVVIVNFTAIYIRTTAQKVYENFCSFGASSNHKKNMLQIWISHHFMWFFFLTSAHFAAELHVEWLRWPYTFYAIPIDHQKMKRAMWKGKTVIYMIFWVEFLVVCVCVCSVLVCYRSDDEHQRWVHIFRPFRLYVYVPAQFKCTWKPFFVHELHYSPCRLYALVD